MAPFWAHPCFLVPRSPCSGSPGGLVHALRCSHALRLEEKPKPVLWRPTLLSWLPTPTLLAQRGHPTYIPVAPPAAVSLPPSRPERTLPFPPPELLALRCQPMSSSVWSSRNTPPQTRWLKHRFLSPSSRVRVPAVGSGEGWSLVCRQPPSLFPHMISPPRMQVKTEGRRALLVCVSVYCLSPIPTLRYKEGISKK